MIEIAAVTHRFDAARGKPVPDNVLENVSLTIADGEFVSFLGPSGCGKTTLLRIIDGLILPKSGAVTVDGTRVAGPAPTRSMVFQEFNLLPWRSAERNAEFGLELDIQKTPKAQRIRVAEDNLGKVGLKGFSNYFPHQLSGGMKQRVGIARALSTAPRYLLMDEPFGALDPMIRELMQIELLKLLGSEQRTIVFVTHSIDEAIFLSDRIVIFGTRPGRILDVLEVDLPKPRWVDDETIKASAAFVEFRQRIWRQLKHELQRTDPRG
jgi:NitT/TauT family transport system ATP-binding protein